MMQFDVIACSLVNCLVEEWLQRCREKLCVREEDWRG